ncbi:N-acetylmuramoyl-L-alanine amidase [Corynebacterium freiburgense]|uniref:N-acetylmuramoyl-L-alanine amidase n=1 Tax=Corynebacterium freiburgense TaxID=556548 RepID=UPI000411B7C6|nr:N-acetylmuramoyl-L-alanine amidase [Corynebacterium freiburgense]WJZ03978.1 Germination-specific N-acetylmuramoyl-L-alanine amidase precursor [Corynebacterium freiburgense]
MTEVLKVGDKSPRVAEVRATLARLGVLRDFHGDASRTFVEEDTFFDAPLAQALQAFQQSRGIIADGHIGDTTLRVLREATFTLGARVLQFEPANPLVGDDVSELQTQLQELGFYTERIDGRFGELTHQAVKNYQLNFGLDNDGICGPNTIRSLRYLGRRITGGSPHAIREREAVRRAGPRLAGKRVVIDPGLGGGTPGRLVKGPFGTITEADILWDLASRVKGRMVAAGMETVMSRQKMANPKPSERAEIANAFGADILISLQCDYYKNEKASGVASFYFGSQDGWSSQTGEMLGSYIQREICARTPLINCGNHARTWEILRLTNMPSVEIFAGYLSNPHDVAILTDPKQRDAIAEAIVVAVKRLYLLDRDDQPTGTYNFSELLKSELL